MGRVLKRVDLNFKWPLNKVWVGYINPHIDKRENCHECQESGLSEYAQELKKQWYSHNGPFEYLPNGGQRAKNALQYNLNDDDIAALIKSNRLPEFTRVPVNEEQKEIIKKQKADGKGGWLEFHNGYTPSAKEVNEWAKQGMGHDSLNCHVVIKVRCEKAKRDYLCSSCNGNGFIWSSEEDEQNYEEWKKTEPPTGEGFQLWETTSEGSPTSPVFKTIEELAFYCENNCSTFGRERATKEQWLKMLDEDFVYHQRGNSIFI